MPWPDTAQMTYEIISSESSFSSCSSSPTPRLNFRLPPEPCTPQVWKPGSILCTPNYAYENIQTADSSILRARNLNHNHNDHHARQLTPPPPPMPQLRHKFASDSYTIHTQHTAPHAHTFFQFVKHCQMIF